MSAAPTDPAGQRASRAAATWLTRHDRGLTAAEQDEFFQWLAEDPDHGAWFSRHRDGWRRLDAIADWRPEHGGEPNPDILAKAPPVRRWRRPALLAGLAAGLACAGIIGWQSAFRPEANLVHAGPGGYERRLLDDGSIAELNRGTEIEVNFTAQERRVVLRRGEAHFTVAKNPARPFFVLARGVAVRAVGTAFNVRHDGAAVEVLVTEGTVQVSPPAPAIAPAASFEVTAAPLVSAGESARVPLAADTALRVAPTSTAELARWRAWQPQLLDFSSVPLGQAIDELNRRNRIQLVLTDPASARVPIVASIRSDNLEGFVSLVSRAVGLRAELRGEYEIVLHPAR